MTTFGRVSPDRDRPQVLTMGEPAGVGGEITLKAWLKRGDGLPPFFVIDDPKRLRDLAARVAFPVPIREIATPDQATSVFPSALPVLPELLAVPSSPGRPDPSNANVVERAIERAVGLVQAGEAAAVVTNPIHKQTMYKGGFRFAGHTEYLAALAKITTAPVMMLACAELRVVPVTVHVSLVESIRCLTTASIIEKAVITAAALKRDFGVVAPRLAIAGLNPHAGEGGDMGNEETTVIRPAIDALKARGIDAVGPLSPDTMFSARARGRYDAAICMYHDQALIPIKTIDFDGAVNLTLGLPFVRTSPDHGTALDIAGTGRANEASLVAAIRMADAMARQRALHR